MRLQSVGAESELHASFLTIGRLINRLDHPTQTWWFLHRTKHRKQSEQEVFKAWVSLEASAVLKHRYSVVARKYVKTSRDGVNIKYTSSYGIVVNKIQSAHEEQSMALCGASAQGTGATQCRMPDETMKMALRWQGTSTPSLPDKQNKINAQKKASRK